MIITQDIRTLTTQDIRTLTTHNYFAIILKFYHSKPLQPRPNSCQALPILNPLNCRLASFDAR